MVLWGGGGPFLALFAFFFAFFVRRAVRRSFEGRVTPPRSTKDVLVSPGLDRLLQGVGGVRGTALGDSGSTDCYETSAASGGTALGVAVYRFCSWAEVNT